MTLNQILPDWYSGDGIFSLLAEDSVETPWSFDLSAMGLDIAYHGQRSGEKFITSMCYNWIDATTGELTEDGISKIILTIQARYYQKWKHLWSIYTTEYSPLDTYSVVDSEHHVQEHKDSDEDTRTPNLTRRDVLDQDDTDTHTTTGSIVHGESIHTESTSDTKEQFRTYGFNSSVAVPASEHDTSNESEATETHSGTDTQSSTTSGTNSRDATNIRTETGNEKTEHENSGSYDLTITRNRKGNMYRSPAELLSFDRDFWMTDYFDIVFEDLDQLLTLGIYSESPVNYTVF